MKHLQKRLRKTAAAAVVFGLLVFGANANAAQIDFETFIRDDGTGLEWRDLTGTFGLSFNTVTGQLGAGGDFEGYRYATVNEVNDFWTNAGIPDIDAGLTVDNFLPVVTLMGQLALGTGGIFSREGIATQVVGTTVVLRVPILGVSIAPPAGKGRANLFSSGTILPDGFDDGEFSPIGSYLVRPVSTVPLPAAFPLFGTGLGLLGFLGWRRRRKVEAAA